MMISGLTYIPSVIPNHEASMLLKHIDSNKWRNDLKRRVQHYGYVYDYRRRTVTPDMQLGNLPAWSAPLIDLLEEHPAFNLHADQMIVNEYIPGQGIAHHIDCEPCFDGVIASFSLNSTCVMSFIHVETKTEKQILLEPNSLLIMSGEARYDWKHGIPARKNDTYDGKRYQRGRRVSVTFRKVIISI